MCSRTWRACDSRCARALVVVRRLAGVEVGGERHLGVDDDDLAAGQADDHVGAQPAVVGGGGHLLVEVAVRKHPGELDDPLQLDLAPASAHVGRPQRGHERRGALAQLRELLARAPMPRRLAGELERPHLAVDLLERLLQRPDVARQLRLRDLEEGGAVRLVRVGRTRRAPRSRPSRRTSAAPRRARRACRRAPSRSRSSGAATRRSTRRVRRGARPRMRARMTIGPTNGRDGVGMEHGDEGTIARRWPGKIAPQPPKRPQAPQRRTTPSARATPTVSAACSTCWPRPALIGLAVVLGVVFLAGAGEDEDLAATMRTPAAS